MSEKVLIDRKLLADLLSQDRETRINAERSLYAQLANTTLPQPAAVEAVEVVAVAFITRAEKSGPKIAITLKKEDAERQHKNWLSMSKIVTTEPLMTVAQHNRIVADVRADQQEIKRLREAVREFAGHFSSDDPKHWELHGLADGADYSGVLSTDNGEVTE